MSAISCVLSTTPALSVSFTSEFRGLVSTTHSPYSSSIVRRYCVAVSLSSHEDSKLNYKAGHEMSGGCVSYVC